MVTTRVGSYFCPQASLSFLRQDRRVIALAIAVFGGLVLLSLFTKNPFSRWLWADKTKPASLDTGTAASKTQATSYTLKVSGIKHLNIYEVQVTDDMTMHDLVNKVSQGWSATRVGKGKEAFTAIDDVELQTHVNPDAKIARHGVRFNATEREFIPVRPFIEVLKSELEAGSCSMRWTIQSTSDVVVTAISLALYSNQSIISRLLPSWKWSNDHRENLNQLRAELNKYCKQVIQEKPLSQISRGTLASLQATFLDISKEGPLVADYFKNLANSIEGVLTLLKA
jgi:hypothetical protein